MSVPKSEDEEVAPTLPSVNELFFFNYFRWDNTVLGFSLHLPRHSHAQLGKLYVRDC